MTQLLSLLNQVFGNQSNNNELEQAKHYNKHSHIE
jgi:hypothetical protein